ncbi:hypothetical protein D9M71_791680 [compost metagenome]
MVILGGIEQIFGDIEQRTVWVAFYLIFPTLFFIFYRGLTKGLRNAWNGIVVEEEPATPRNEWFTYMVAGGTSAIILAPVLAEHDYLKDVPYFVIASAVFISAALMLAILRWRK